MYMYYLLLTEFEVRVHVYMYCKLQTKFFSPLI